MELGMSIIIQLYLLENETSKLIWVPHALGILLTIWKISQACKLESS
jgi:hypothetical protein